MTAAYTSIQNYISTAPSCAVPCLDAFWSPYIESCGNSDWSCLCAVEGGTTNLERQLTDDTECQIPFCSSEDMNSFGIARGNLVAFCVRYPAASNSTSASTTSSTSTSTTSMASSVTSQTVSITSNSTTTGSSTSTTTTKSSSSSQAAEPRVTNPLESKASPFSPSVSLVILGSLWLALTVFSGI